MNNKIYAFMYCSCIYESSAQTMSLHFTKKGAYKAMRTYLTNEYNKWREEGLLYGKQMFKFGIHESWFIEELKVDE